MEAASLQTLKIQKSVGDVGEATTPIALLRKTLIKKMSPSSLKSTPLQKGSI